MTDIDGLKQAFDHEGFVCLRGFLSGGEVSEVNFALDRYLEDRVPTLDKDQVLYETLGGERVLKQLVDMHRVDPFFDGILNDRRTVDLATGLLGEPASPRTVEYFYKAPRVGTPTPAHQDGFYFCLKPNHALTLWLALVDCDGENGCLNYVRGSHLAGIQGHGDSGVVGFSQGLKGVDWDEADVARMQLHAGDLLVHHSKTIHFADANTSDRPRRALGMVYFANSSERDEAAWEHYQNSLTRQRENSQQQRLHA